MAKTIGNFAFNEITIEGVHKIDVKKYGDNRGYFMETYKKAGFDTDEDGVIKAIRPFNSRLGKK